MWPKRVVRILRLTSLVLTKSQKEPQERCGDARACPRNVLVAGS